MKQSEVSLPVLYADEALWELNEIGDWNRKAYGQSHAKNYISFLARHINALGKNYESGKPVSTRPDLRYIQMRKRTKGHGHVAVYIYDAYAVTVLHIFHTAQDWQNKLIQGYE